MEEVEKNFYVDGAHNGDGCRAFLESAVPLARNRHTMLLYAAMKDKDYQNELREIASSKVLTMFLAFVFAVFADLIFASDTL